LIPHFDDRIAVGNVGLDGDRALAQIFGKRFDAVGATGEQRQTVAVGGQDTGGGLADS
jgi:hypothetical protein